MLELDEAFLKWWLVYVKRLIFHINFVDRSVETLLACVHGLVLWLFSTAWTKKFCLSRYRNLKVFPLNTFSFDTNFTFSSFVRPWNENTRTKQKQQMNENRAIWLVYRTDTNARSFWSVLRTFGCHARELCRNQSILDFDVILQHDWPIEQCLLHIRVFFGGKTKSPCFDLFIHWLIKQITNIYRNHFARSYKTALSYWHSHVNRTE